MQVHRDIEQLPFFKNAVITIGTFDGVHLGHRKIIDALKKEAALCNGETVIITFHPHPRTIVNNDYSLQLITTLSEKEILLAALGVDHLVIVPFTLGFAEQSADEYIRDFLIARFNPHTIIIGYDHRFGKARAGNLIMLEENAACYKYKLIEIPKYVIDEISISSTNIRKALVNSDVETANKLLGYSFFFEGIVVKGDAIGRTIGYPTANLEYVEKEKIHLGHGVYAVYATIGNQQKKGMLSIGTRPTIEDTLHEKIEVNLFDFEGNLYHQTIKVLVQKYLRPQVKYHSLEELKEQLKQDKEQSLACLS